MNGSPRPELASEARRASRRRFLRLATAAGGGSLVFGRALAALAADAGKVTTSMIRRAEWIAGIELGDDERRLMRAGLAEAARDFAALRGVPLDNAILPALRFDAEPFAAPSAPPDRAAVPAPPPWTGPRPSDDDLAFATIGELGGLLRARAISSVELTRFYLERLRGYDPLLRCAVTITEDLALRQAEQADRDLRAGSARGPLHGIPWGAKDLLAVPGYPTTWGASPFKDQVRPEEATAVARLREAGAVLVAKLSLGELAWGDVWFGGMTRNPWNPEQGSSGSSAGPASATAAGLVCFTLGSETWGSIVSPCTRCGATGLRPTFGRVSRHGAMALAWSMDKLGPIARSVEDCALVFAAIHGADGRDPTAVDRPFAWPFRGSLRSLRVGFVPALFEESPGADADEKTRALVREWQEIDRRTLDVLRQMGFELVPFELPAAHPVGPLAHILVAEAAAAFDELTRSGRVDLLARQVEQAWPNVFRQGLLLPAVDYIRANRVRAVVMEEMRRAIEGIDVYVTPSFGGDHLLLTNLTGHPTVVVPNGFRPSDGTPTSITFSGPLFGEAQVLALARAYQQETGWHRRRPPLPPQMVGD